MSGISGQSIGVGWVQSSMSEGVRRSSSTTYLADSNDRPNLTVLINAMVMKLLPTPSISGFKAFRTVEFTDSRSTSGNALPLEVFNILPMLKFYKVSPHSRSKPLKRLFCPLDQLAQFKFSNSLESVIALTSPH